jgi:hypothetical protein
MTNPFDIRPEIIEIGSRVRVIKDSDSHFYFDNLIGTIVAKNGSYRYDWGVDLDYLHCPEGVLMTKQEGHRLHGELKEPTGRWFRKEDLEIIYD